MNGCFRRLRGGRQPLSGAAEQAAEHEAAVQRILEQAEAERLPVEDTTRTLPDRWWRRDQD